MRLYPSCDGQTEGSVSDARLVISLAQRRHFAHRQQTAHGPQVGLNDVIGIVHQAFAIGVEALEAFTAGDQYIHFPCQSRRSLKVVLANGSSSQ